MPLPVHWLNLKAGAALGVNDRGFRYGDSLFETMRYCRGQWHLLDYHLQRLQHGCLALELPYSDSDVRAQLDLATQYLLDNSLDEACGRLALTRGDGAAGYGGHCEQPNLILSLSPVNLAWGEVASAARLVRCTEPLAAQTRLAGIKHGNRLEQVMAAREVSRLGGDEGLLSNPRGNLVSAVSANVFCLVNDRLTTPPLTDCGIEGTVRRFIIDELAGQAGIEVEEAEIPWAELESIQEMFITNALVGIRSVEQLAGHSFTSTRWGDTLRELFFARVESSQI
jgi:4-amino-4-deoxychorismate lyase